MLVFDHIPKTAGTTFKRGYLKAAFPSSAKWIISGERNAEDLQRLIALPQTERDRIAVVAGHYVDALRPHLSGARFITVIRDPVERAISSYLHARYHADGSLWPDVRAESLTLGQYVERYEGAIADYQSRVVLGDDYQGLDDDEVRARLAARYTLVGCTEAFDSFVFMLHVTDGLPLCLYTNRLTRPERQHYTADAGDLARLRACTQGDARLHRIVAADFNARVERLPGEWRQIHEQFLEALRAFRTEAGETPRAERWRRPSGRRVAPV